MHQKRFSEGERVLCYDPNPTRLRVLYDAKILRVNKTKDDVEYYIHFLGWSNSWDRYISTDLLLEDNEENRQLQAELNAEAKKRMPQKKRNRLGASKIGSNGCSSTVSESSREDSASDEDSDVEPVCDTFALSLPDALRERLAHEQDLVKNKGKLHKLPCSRDIVSILENYVQHFAFQLHYVRAANDSIKRSRSQMQAMDRRTEIELCKETVDGLRILFNNLCDRVLLYKEELKQFAQLSELTFNRDVQEKQHQSRRTSELELLLAQLEYSFIANKLPQAWDNETHRARSLRLSTQHASIASGTLKREDEDQSDSATITSWTSATSPATSELENATKWRMAENGLWPAQVYGAYHLVRLLSQVPFLVPRLKMPRSKADVLQRHLTLLLNYLSENEMLFEDQFE
ncbi:male-specific lethal 3-like [Tropilaelaps mercedesae]|uniref:Male-specific lethal 3-like n=1 Tax=Tropilaelaps mercedesae TaxID=418985 RepID=A0A1V9XY32_9ACAR|nr:male-specific lethal 3-like [Tropilaelaps mercedesae]